MVKKRFVCDRCEESFLVEVLEAGEAEGKRGKTRPGALREMRGACSSSVVSTAALIRDGRLS